MKARSFPLVVILVGVVLLAIGLQTGRAAPSADPGTMLISVPQPGMGEAGASNHPSISDDGRLVAFDSGGSNLTGDDDNGVFDVFLRDWMGGSTIRISDAPGEVEDGSSESPAISGDGRYVAFQSDASNLVVSDTNGVTDVFVRHITSPAIVRVSIATNGEQGDSSSIRPAISDNGRHVAFASAANNFAGESDNDLDIFVHDRDADDDGIFDEPGQVSTSIVSVTPGGEPGNAISQNPAISGDGRFVAFESFASDLTGDDSDDDEDVFLRDLDAGTTTRVSKPQTGDDTAGRSTDPDISDDGRFVAFTSTVQNLVAGDGNNRADVFVHDTTDRSIERISVTSMGGEIAADALEPAISGDGRFVAFSSTGAFVGGDNNNQADIFLRNRETLETTRVSVGSGGTEANAGSTQPDVNRDGRYIAFESLASNLGGDNGAGLNDIFLHDTGVEAPTPTPTQTHTPSATATGNPTVTATGTVEATTTATGTTTPTGTAQATTTATVQATATATGTAQATVTGTPPAHTLYLPLVRR